VLFLNDKLLSFLNEHIITVYKISQDVNINVQRYYRKLSLKNWVRKYTFYCMTPETGRVYFTRAGELRVPEIIRSQ